MKEKWSKILGWIVKATKIAFGVALSFAAWYLVENYPYQPY